MHLKFLQESGPCSRPWDSQVSANGLFQTPHSQLFYFLQNRVPFKYKDTIPLTDRLPSIDPSKQCSAQGHPFVTEALIANHNPACNAG